VIGGRRSKTLHRRANIETGNGCGFPALDAEPGPRSLELRGEIQRKSKGKQNQPPIVAVTPIQFAVPPILSLSLDVESIDAFRGRQIPIRLPVKRNSTVAAPMTQETSRLPRGLAISPLKIPAGVDEVTLNIADAKVSSIRGLVNLSPGMLIEQKNVNCPHCD